LGLKGFVDVDVDVDVDYGGSMTSFFPLLVHEDFPNLAKDLNTFTMRL